ncbi:MAG TPA: Gfo/Idh/MocA family oxidoreductase [Terriglobia bacterium]|nr:Gfo/Idh/MocA family oxidoreductase [Terriglobia bacterium]
MPAKKLRWGIVSTAKIATEKVIPGLLRSQRCDVVGIASRDLHRAEAAVKKLGLKRAYGSYEELLADPEIDVIYNPLPNHLHVPVTLQAAASGKHVLCEKPIGLDAEDAAQLHRIGDKVQVLEAFMVRFHPQWLRARDLVEQGAIGPVQAIQVYFSYFNADPNNIRNKRDIGGGAALDIGCYPIVIARFIFKAEPERVIALIDRDPVTGVDRLTSGLLDFGDGRRLDFTVGTQSVPYQRVQIIGSKGRIEIQIPFNAPQAATTLVFCDDGSKLDGSAIVTETIAACDQYALEGDAFVEMILGERPCAYGIEDAIQNMRILDALFRSEESGRWEKP